jgi:hypothetical protein
MTKGYFFDQGLKPTHKAEIIALYEQGFDEVGVTRRSGQCRTLNKDHGRIEIRRCWTIEAPDYIAKGEMG